MYNFLINRHTDNFTELYFTENDLCKAYCIVKDIEFTPENCLKCEYCKELRVKDKTVLCKLIYSKEYEKYLENV